MTIDTLFGFFYARYMLRLKNRQRGFTLIELLVVIAIIGILASFLLVNFVGVRARARDAQRKSDLKQIQAALEFYRSDNGSYPDSASGGLNLLTGSPKYLNAVPSDPTTAASENYNYQRTATGRYCLQACLENTSDKDRKTSGCGVQSCTSGAYYVVQNP